MFRKPWTSMDQLDFDSMDFVILMGWLLINYFICWKANVSLVLNTSPQWGDIRASLSNGFRRLHYPGDCSRILVSSNYQCHSWHHCRRYRETWETPKLCCWGLSFLSQHSLESSWISRVKKLEMSGGNGDISRRLCKSLWSYVLIVFLFSSTPMSKLHRHSQSHIVLRYAPISWQCGVLCLNLHSVLSYLANTPSLISHIYV